MPARLVLAVVLMTLGAALPLVAQEAADDAAGWVTLFDGETLAGWVTRGGRHDGAARWTVEEGAITGRQGPARQGGLLYTETVFANAVLECDVRIDAPFDSGLFVRMVPDARGVQVTLDDRPDGEIGGLYADGWLRHDEDGRGAAAWRRGSWNRVRVVVTDQIRVRAFINGVLVQDATIDEARESYAPAGRIGLQVHGGEDVPPEARVQFKALRARALPLREEPVFVDRGDGVETISHGGLLHGWRSLMNGRDLEGFAIPAESDKYEVADGLLRIEGGGSGALMSGDDFRDFELRVDVKLDRLANSGIYLRSDRREGNPSFTGAEIQIIDDHDWAGHFGTPLEPWQVTGSLYGAVPPRVRALRPTGDWNRFEILYVGSRLRVVVNGEELYDVDTLALDADPPFAQRAREGFIGFQRYGSPDDPFETGVTFRNVFIKTH